MRPVVDACAAIDQINSHAWRYLLDVGHFTRTHMIKAGKDKEFGRVFQLGRIKGNFLYVLASTSLRILASRERKEENASD